MSRIDDLLLRLAPDGVPFMPLGEVGTLVRGNGMPKSAFTETGVGCIHYGQIYTHYGTWATETISFVPPETAARLVTVDPGDVIITNTSENLNDVCKAVAWLGHEPIVTGGHATVLKHDQDARYLAYYLQTPSFFAAKRAHAAGTKVIEVSASNLARIRVPLPPREVQAEIVRILDGFKELEAELEAALDAELEARHAQYAHYSDALLTFRDGQTRWTTLGEIGSLFGGLTGKSRADFEGGTTPYIPYVSVFKNIRASAAECDLFTLRRGERQNAVARGDVLFTSSSETREESGMSSVVVSEPLQPTYLNSFCFGFRPAPHTGLDPEFAKYLFRGSAVREQIVRTANGVTRFNISRGPFLKVRVPMPPLDEQRRIAEVLDSFDALVNDLSSSLPAEIATRRQQYEHYRDRLLTFKESRS